MDFSINYIFEQNHKFLLIRLQTTNIRNGVITELNSEIIDYDINRINLNANIPSQFKIVSEGINLIIMDIMLYGFEN